MSENTPKSSPKSLKDAWSVWRQDDAGNLYEMFRNLSKKDADDEVKKFTARGHKQSYHAEPTKPVDLKLGR